MDWLSDLIWTVAKNAIAMSGSAIGLFAGLNKISRTAKARQDIEWINGTIDKDTDNEPRQKILKELRLSPEGRLIAAHYVPWWKFMLLPAWAIGYAAPTIQSVNRNGNLNDLALSSSIYLLVCFYLSWLTVGWYAERVRINEHYRAGRSIEARMPLWKMDLRPFRSAVFCSFCPIFLYFASILIVMKAPAWFTAGSLLVGFYSLWFTMPFTRRFAHEWSKDVAKDSIRYHPLTQEVALKVQYWLGKPPQDSDFKDEVANDG